MAKNDIFDGSRTLTKGQVRIYDGNRHMPDQLDEIAPVTRHATWASIRERQRQGKPVPQSFSLDEVELIVKTAVAEALREVRGMSLGEDAEMSVAGK